MLDLEKAKPAEILSFTDIVGDPINIHIIKSGNVSPQMYLVVYESALDSIAIEKGTQEQIELKYGINLEGF